MDILFFSAVSMAAVYSDDVDPHSGHADPPLGLTSFWPCQKGTV